MRLLITLFMTLSVSFAVQAKPAAKFNGQLLSYQTLVQLPAKKRMQYLRDLGELLAVMEKAQSRYEVADNSSIQTIKEQIAFMMQMMAILPEAQAENAPVGTGSATTVPRTPRWSGEGWTCVGQNVAFDPTLGTCAVQQTTGFRRTPTFWFAQNTCPDNTTAVGAKGGSRKCIPNESFFALSRERRRDVVKGVRYPSDYFQGETAESTRDVTLGGNTHNTDGSVVQGTGRPGTPDPAIAVAGGTVIPAQSVAVEPAPNPARPAACVKPTFACNNLEDAAKNDLVSKFRSNRSSNVCIAGGFFSEYKTPEKKIGSCNVKREFKFTSKRAKACDKPNEAMCNPAVFCVGMKVDDKVRALVKGDKDPAIKAKLPEAALATAITVEGEADKILQIFVCAKVGQDLTEQCNVGLKAHVAGQKQILGKGESYVACDPTKMKGMPIQDEWDELRKNVEKQYRQWCSNTQAEFTALFCKECQIIADRIMAMNDAATGEPCAAPAGARSATPGSGSPETIPEGQGAG